MQYVDGNTCVTFLWFSGVFDVWVIACCR